MILLQAVLLYYKVFVREADCHTTLRALVRNDTDSRRRLPFSAGASPRPTTKIVNDNVRLEGSWGGFFCVQSQFDEHCSKRNNGLHKQKNRSFFVGLWSKVIHTFHRVIHREIWINPLKTGGFLVSKPVETRFPHFLWKTFLVYRTLLK